MIRRGVVNCHYHTTACPKYSMMHVDVDIGCSYYVSDEVLYMMTSLNGNIFRVTGPLCGGIHRSPVNYPHKGQWRRALMFSLIRASLNGWVNTREAGDLRRYRAHYDVIVMWNVLLYIVFHLLSDSVLRHHGSCTPYGHDACTYVACRWCALFSCGVGRILHPTSSSSLALQNLSLETRKLETR